MISVLLLLPGGLWAEEAGSSGKNSGVSFSLQKQSTNPPRITYRPCPLECRWVLTNVMASSIASKSMLFRRPGTLG